MSLKTFNFKKMKKYAFLIVFAIAISQFLACQSDSNQQVSDSNQSGETTEKQVKKPKHKIINSMGVLPAQLFAQKLEDPNITLIDLRTPAELAKTGIIKGAVNIDFEAGGVEEKFATYKKDSPILVYCASGGRSHEAYLILQKMGFSKVYDLNGGINAWISQEMPVEKAK